MNEATATSLAETDHQLKRTPTGANQQMSKTLRERLRKTGRCYSSPVSAHKRSRLIDCPSPKQQIDCTSTLTSTSAVASCSPFVNCSPTNSPISATTALPKTSNVDSSETECANHEVTSACVQPTGTCITPPNGRDANHASVLTTQGGSSVAADFVRVCEEHAVKGDSGGRLPVDGGSHGGLALGLQPHAESAVSQEPHGDSSRKEGSHRELAMARQSNGDSPKKKRSHGELAVGREPHGDSPKKERSHGELAVGGEPHGDLPIKLKAQEKLEVDGSSNVADLLMLRLQLLDEVTKKEERLRKLKMVKMYRAKNDLAELEELTTKWRETSQRALEELMTLTSTDPAPTMTQIIQHLGIDPALLRFNSEEETFS